MKIRGLRALASMFIVFSLLSAFSATAFAIEIPGDGDQRVPEFPVAPEVITGMALLATFPLLRRKNRSK